MLSQSVPQLKLVVEEHARIKRRRTASNNMNRSTEDAF